MIAGFLGHCGEPFGSLQRLRVNGRKVRTPLREWEPASLKTGHYTSEVWATRLVTPGEL
jgi:hypothetical protein